MNLFAILFSLICYWLKPSLAPNRTISLFDNETLLLINDMKINQDFMYYISGGKREPETIKLIKYVVSIRTRHPQKYFGDNHYCAGTIISKTAVLTSAHCVMDKRRVLTRSRRLLLVAGTPNRLEPADTTVQFPVESIVANTNFVRNNKNDIAVIRLKTEVPEDNENIKIIKMPSGPPRYNESCTIIGWGRMLLKGPLAALPLHVNVRLYQPWECKQFLRENYYDGVLCAGDVRDNDEDPCRGDTGGPLICNGELTGIISWTLGCGSSSFISLYTDVWHHKKWVEDNLNVGFLPDINIKLFIIITVAIFMLN